jgi:hypothetical protein
MGDPTYEAIRARERAEAEAGRLIAEAGRTAAQAFTDFFNGRAALQITPSMGGMGAGGMYPGWSIRFIRDAPAPTQTKV